MVRLAMVLVVCVFGSACALSTPKPTASPGSLPSRAALRAAFEKLGVKLQEETLQGASVLVASNSTPGSGDRAFLGVEIVGDPVKQVIVTLGAFSINGAGRFPGSALIDVMDSFDPGVKRWFVAEESDPRLAGLAQELDRNGFVAQIPPTHVPGAVLVIERPPPPALSN